MISAMISRLLTILIGVLYPAYASYRALRSSKYDDTKQWLVYWVVFATFTITEGIADFLLAWIPLYRELKLFLVLWLVSPGTDGSTLLYGELISPILEQHEGKLLETMSKSRDQLYKLVGQLFSMTCNRVKVLCSQYSGMMVSLKV